jgi:hypothetical protein
MVHCHGRGREFESRRPRHFLSPRYWLEPREAKLAITSIGIVAQKWARTYTSHLAVRGLLLPAAAQGFVQLNQG